MALTTLHVACCFAGVLSSRDSELPIISTPVWSENLAAGVTSTNVAPAFGDTYAPPGRDGQPMMRVTPPADWYVAIGAAPNATSGARHFCEAFVQYDFAVQPGDKIQGIAA